MNLSATQEALTLLEMDDTQLVELAKQGNQEAFSCLYDRYLPKVYKTVWFKIPSEYVEDITHEIFLQVIRSLANFRGESQFSTWLWTLSQRQIVDFYRSKQWKNTRFELEQETIDDFENHFSCPDSPDIDTNIVLRQAMQKLPEHYQEILLLRFVEGYKFREIAKLTGKKLEATKSLYRRAITELRLILGV